MLKWALALGVVALTAVQGSAPAQVAGAGQAPTLVAAQPEERLPLMVGDPAPELFVKHWVKGEPITGFEKGQAYVVEFWATWCPPCKASVSHLSRVQKEYKDQALTVLGVSIWEESAKDRPDEAAQLKKVQKFVESNGDQMAYTVALADSPKMTAAWMKNAGQRTIPTAFVVNRDGNVAWIGCPVNEMADALNPDFETSLRAVVNGTHDLNAQARAHAQAMRPVIEQWQRQGRLTAAVEAGDWARAIEAVRAAVESDPPGGRAAFQATYESLLLGKKNYEAAYALGLAATEKVFFNDAEMLNIIAWRIVDPEHPVPTKDLDLALRAAQRAVDLEGENAAILDTLATVHVERGDLAKALPLQEKAAKLSVGTGFEAEIKHRLEQIREMTRKKDR